LLTGVGRTEKASSCERICLAKVYVNNIEGGKERGGKKPKGEGGGTQVAPLLKP